MSQEQLGSPDVSDSYISLIESGKRKPAPQVIDTLARKLGCSAFYLEYGLSDKVLAEWAARLQHASTVLARGEADDALSMFTELVHCPGLDLIPDLRRRARRGLVMSLEASGHVDEAIDQLEHAATDATEIDLTEWVALRVWLCRCHYRKGELTKAIDVAEEALTRLRSANLDGSDAGISAGLVLVELYQARGDTIASQRLVNQLAQTVGAAIPGTTSLLFAPAAQAQHHRPDRGGLGMHALAGMHQDTTTESIIGPGVLQRAHLLLLLNRPGDAEQAYDLLKKRDNDLTVNGDNARDKAACLTGLACAGLVMGRLGEAVVHARRAKELLGDTAGCESALAISLLGHIHARRNEHDEAIASLTHAGHLFEQAGYTYRAAQVWYAAADVQRQSGVSDRELVKMYRHALTLAGICALEPGVCARRSDRCTSAS